MVIYELVSCINSINHGFVNMVKKHDVIPKWVHVPWDHMCPRTPFYNLGVKELSNFKGHTFSKIYENTIVISNFLAHCSSGEKETLLRLGHGSITQISQRSGLVH